MFGVYSIGKSVKNRHLWVTRISHEMAFSRKRRQKRKQLKPMVKIVANMHGNEVIKGLLMYVMCLPLLKVIKTRYAFGYVILYKYIYYCAKSLRFDNL